MNAKAAAWAYRSALEIILDILKLVPDWELDPTDLAKKTFKDRIQFPVD
jgi:hypothetical protein